MSSPGDENLLPTKDSYFDAAEDATEFTLSSPDSGVHDLSQMDAASQEKARDEWTRELAKTEDEIAALRSALSLRIKKMQDLKRKLGITVWKEFKDDVEQGIKNIQGSTAYQKTSQTLKTAGEKTTEAFGSLGATVTKKFEEVKQSQAFKTIEEKVGNAYSNVKTKVGGGSISQAEEALTENSNESQIPTEKS